MRENLITVLRMGWNAGFGEPKELVKLLTSYKLLPEALLTAYTVAPKPK